MTDKKKAEDTEVSTIIPLSDPKITHDDEYDTFKAIFVRCSAAILGSKDINITSEALDYLVVLAEEHMQELFLTLHQISEVQRRKVPSISDIAIWMRETGQVISGLQKEMKIHSKYTDALNNLRVDPDPEEMDPEEAKFFAPPSLAIKKVVPSRNRLNGLLPTWMPQLPPDHTFMSTPEYTERVEDLKGLREMVVEEGRMAERALQRFVGSYNIQGDDLVVQDYDKEMGDIENGDESRAGSVPGLDDVHESASDTEMKDLEPSENGFDTTSTDQKQLPVLKIKPLSIKVSLGPSKASPNPYDADPCHIYTAGSRKFDVVEYARKQAKKRAPKSQKELTNKAETFDDVFAKALGSINTGSLNEMDFTSINWHSDWYEK